MRISVISDDLTGASDCGGQLVRYGLDVSVVLTGHNSNLNKKEALIFNTDSRAVSEKEAYERVKKVCERVKSEAFDVIYKKIDSTMRGNIGQEINAVYDVFQPDFVFIAPAFPEAGRQVINGVHFLNQKQLHETEVGNDPKTPVNDSLITRVIKSQAQREVGHLSYKDLHAGYEFVIKKLKAFKNQKVSYITVDSVHESDLKYLVEMIKKTEFSVVWSGSSGLINYLPQAYGLQQYKKKVSFLRKDKPVLFVIGSVSKVGRNQLRQLLLNSDTIGLEINPSKIILDSASKQKELSRVTDKALKSLETGKSIALFSSGEVKKTHEIGKKQGFSAIEMSDYISMTMGEVAVALINQCNITNLFLTGGDTAQQVLSQLQVHKFHLLDEVEPGIPLGKLDYKGEIFAVTKAGSFGTDLAMLKAKSKLQGKKDAWEHSVILSK
ncbi:four-carbon acid sugar kinase family protein [Priestia aryabhattai]|uniref:four-carbon acid sugar kinase family protein n=1 Tax=Priestia megaterium TaxID=1404 RepID=UPI0039B8C2BF